MMPSSKHVTALRGAVGLRKRQRGTLRLLGLLSRVPWGGNNAVVIMRTFRESGLSVPQPIQNMAAQRVALGQPGIIEVVGWIASHTKLLHYAPRS
jgi:hypothetical protein